MILESRPWRCGDSACSPSALLLVLDEVFLAPAPNIDGQVCVCVCDVDIILFVLASMHMVCVQVDEKPTEDYSDVGGLDKQIQELVEAIVLPIKHKDRFDKIGIKPPKGCLLYGPPGTGKTLMARACAAQTEATFLKLAGPQLVQMFIGDGAKLVRDAFTLAKEKAPAIIFIDEIDAIGTKRFDSEKSGDREVQRTMLELLNQLDGFSSSANVKIIAATNRADILDPALMRSGESLIISLLKLDVCYIHVCFVLGTTDLAS